MLQQVLELLRMLLGVGRDAGDVGAGQMVLRAIVIYVATLATVRLGSKRFLGKATAFDVIIGIMIGSVMSRGINGSADVGATLLGGGALVAMHWLFAVLAYHTTWFGDIVKGKPVLLIEDGRPQRDGMRQTSLSERDLHEAIRLQGSRPDPSRVGLAYLERNGTVSVIPRDADPHILEVAVERGVQTLRIQLE
jgi:uncharacterized membrane protein YcaP (DUF421 family)